MSTEISKEEVMYALRCLAASNPEATREEVQKVLDTWPDATLYDHNAWFKVTAAVDTLLELSDNTLFPFPVLNLPHFRYTPERLAVQHAEQEVDRLISVLLEGNHVRG